MVRIELCKHCRKFLEEGLWLECENCGAILCLGCAQNVGVARNKDAHAAHYYISCKDCEKKVDWEQKYRDQQAEKGLDTASEL